MKKVSLLTVLAALLLILGTGCLKDKGFENGQYGINVADRKAVSFPNAGSSPLSFGLNVTASPQLVNDLLAVSLETSGLAEANISVTLSNTSGTASEGDVKNYNDNNPGANVQVLPTDLYSVPLTATITAGQKFVKLPLTVFNTTSLDPNLPYGIGFTISSATNGYQVAQNMRKILVIFSVKNRLDGVYEITGSALRAGDPVLSGDFGPYERSIETSGPNSGQWKGSVLWANGASSALPAGYEPNITVDPATDVVTSITSTAGIFMTAPVVRTDIVGAVQRYDVATKTLYFEFTYGAGPASRLFSIKAKYVRPR